MNPTQIVHLVLLAVLMVDPGGGGGTTTPTATRDERIAMQTLCWSDRLIPYRLQQQWIDDNCPTIPATFISTHRTQSFDQVFVVLIDGVEYEVLPPNERTFIPFGKWQEGDQLELVFDAAFQSFTVWSVMNFYQEQMHDDHMMKIVYHWNTAYIYMNAGD